MEFLVGVLILVLLVRWAVISSRLRKMERSTEDQAVRSAARIRELTDRVTVLENAARESSSLPVALPKPEPVPATVRPPVMPPPLPVREPVRGPVCQFCGRAAAPGINVCVCGAVLGPARAVPEPEPTLASVASPHVPLHVPPPIPEESLRDRIRNRVGDQEWEAMVGGNWLNKAGVLLLVIGIALLLGYEWRAGPGWTRPPRSCGAHGPRRRS